MAGEKTTPLDTESVESEVSRGADETSRLPERIARYGKAKKRAVSMSRFIASKGDETIGSRADHLKKLANTIDGCANYLLFKNYFTVGKVRLTKASFCKKHKLCPMCAIRRSAKQVKSYIDRYELIQKEHPELTLIMVTLTVKNGEDLRERYDHLEKSFRLYQSRRRNYFKRFQGFNELCKLHGAVYSYEITNKGNGWHPHIHVLALISKGEMVDNKILSKEWLSITGDSKIVDVRPVYGEISRGFIEVLKYALKFSDLSLELNFHAFDILLGKKMLGSFGLFRGVKIPQSFVDEDLDKLPYFEILYQYFDKSGYSITDTGILTREKRLEPETV